MERLDSAPHQVFQKCSVDCADVRRMKIRLSVARARFAILEESSSGPVAQVVEQRPFKAWVEGSSPSWLTTHKLFQRFPSAIPISNPLTVTA